MVKRKIKKELREIWKTSKRIYSSRRRKYFFKYSMNILKTHFLNRTNSTKIAYPTSFMIELTNQCNIACTTCPREHRYGEEMNKGMMNMEVVKKIIDEVYPYVETVMLTGLGETLMYKKITLVIEYIKSKNKDINILISTNAVLPNFIEKATLLVGKVDSIQISIDGLGEIYDAIRLKSDFILFDKNIREFVKLCKGTSTKLRFNMVVTKQNYFQMPLLVEYADEIGIDEIEFTSFNLVSAPSIPVSYYEFYRSKDFLEIFSKLDSVAKSLNHIRVFKSNFEQRSGFQNCSSPWKNIMINYDGLVPPCCAKPFSKEKNFGDTRTQKVINVINSPDIRNWRERWFENKTPDFCKKCHIVDF